ncbi:MAG: hypothetical protein LIO69_08960 [Oscillospiraceae bacterium]|nr:hypothetical protein [Oscillospiraceae bacterium]
MMVRVYKFKYLLFCLSAAAIFLAMLFCGGTNAHANEYCFGDNGSCNEYYSAASFSPVLLTSTVTEGEDEDLEAYESANGNDFVRPILGIVTGIAFVILTILRYRNYKKVSAGLYVKYDDIDITYQSDLLE